MAILNYDARGFIIGLNRIEQQTSNVHDDTQEIIRILKGQRQISDTRLQSLQETLSQINSGISNINRHEAAVRRASNRTQGREQGTNGNANSRPSTPAGTRGASRIHRSTDTQSQSNGQNASRGRGGRVHPPVETQDNNHGGGRGGAGRSVSGSQDRNRDSRGRFTAAAEDSSFINRLSDRIGDSFRNNAIDDNNIDPLIDSFNEVKTIFSPVTGMFNLLTGGRNKPSRYERRRDRNITDTLDDIAENTSDNRGGGGGRGGLLGGLMGRFGGTAIGGLLGGAAAGGLRGLKFLGGKGGKVLGPLAAIIGAGSLAMNWDNLDTKGKAGGVGNLAGSIGGGWAGAAAGAAVGSVVPVIGTAVGAAVGGIAGAWFGSDAGQALGEASAPYINRWTGNLDRADLPNKMLDNFTKGLNPLFEGGKNIWELIKEKLGFKKDSQIPTPQGGYWNNMWGGLKQRFGFGGGGAGGDTSGGDFSIGDVDYKSGSASGYDKKLGLKRNSINTATNYRAGNIGGLDDAMTRRLVASTVGTESAGGNHRLTNKGGYLGRYQTGAGYLAMAGMIKGGAAAVKAAKARDGYAGRSDWDWGLSGGQARFLKNPNNWVNGMSYEKYMNSPELQDIAFQRGTSANYRSLERAGVLRGKSPAQIAGLLKAAHLGGVGNAIKVARGGIGAKDANGTSTRKYYEDVALNKDGLGGRNIVGSPPKATPATAKAPIPVPRQTKEQAKMTPKQVAEERTKRLTSVPLPLKPQVKAASTPAVPRLNIPTIPSIPQKLSSDTPKVIVASNNQDLIPQNVRDRGLADAITGGLGEDRYLIG